MKTTIDVPDDLYRKVKAKSAIQGRRVRDVTVELFQHWVEGGWEEKERDSPAATRKWLRQWFALADRAMKKAPPGPSAREILKADRNRLERR